MTDQDMTADSGAVNLPKIVSREEAKAAGLKRYFTGETCKHGHIADRLVSNKGCMACAYERTSKYSTGSERTRAYNVAYRAANPDKIRELRSGWVKANPEKVRSMRASHRLANAEKLRSSSAEYYAANKSRLKAYHAEWRAANPDKALISVHKRRARKMAAPGSHTAADVRNVYERQGGMCSACAAELAVTGYQKDHIVSLADGGSNWPDNLQILCRSCNASKGAKNYQVWLDQNKEKLDKKRAYWIEWRELQSAADAAF